MTAKKKTSTAKKPLKVKKETLKDLDVPARRTRSVKGGLKVGVGDVGGVARGCCWQGTDCWSKFATPA